jgi:hypothetical protein
MRHATEARFAKWRKVATQAEARRAMAAIILGEWRLVALATSPQEQFLAWCNS